MKAILWALTLSAAAVLAATVIARPEWVSDSNNFLAEFVSHEILNVYGIFVVITLASSSQLHLSLNAIEERKRKVYFHATRESIRRSCFGLATMFCVAVIALIIKGMNEENELICASINAASIWILLVNILIMWDITRTIFMVKPEIRSEQSINE